jgi:DNA-directed RNA polymerase subunit L
MSEFELKTNHTIVNSIRRVIFQKVPYYAFSPKNITFVKNTSIYNNDLLRVRFSNIPVLGLPNDDKTFHDYLENNYTWVVNNEKIVNVVDKKKTEIDSIYENDTSVEIQDDTSILSMYCKAIHDDQKTEFLNITTDHCEFFINDKKITNPYKKPLLLLKLRFGEEIEFSTSSKMSTPTESPIYCIADNVYFTELEPDVKYLLKIISTTTKPQVIIKRALTIIKEMLKVSNSLIENIEEESNNGILEIRNDKFTLASLLTFYLQEHKDIEYAGCQCEHLLANTSVIYYTLKAGSEIKKILPDVCKTIEKDIDKIYSKI